MKKQRALPELFQLMINNKDLFKSKCNGMGLCYFTHILRENRTITKEEMFFVDDYVDENRPRKTRNNFYAWPNGEWTPREKWLKNQIKKLTL